MGIDASTTTVAVSIIEMSDTNKILHQSHFKPNKKNGLFSMLAGVKKFISDIIDKFKPDEVVLEDIVQFMKGASGAKTIISLAVINRMIGFAVYEKTSKEPVLLNVLKIRHSIKKDKAFPKKEEIPNLVSNILSFDFPWKYDKKGKPRVENYDEGDAIAVALSYCVLYKKAKSQPVKKINNKVVKKKR